MVVRGEAQKTQFWHPKRLELIKNNVLWAPPPKTMQKHLEITWKNQKHRPNGAAAPVGAPPKAAPLCSLFLVLLYHKYLWMFFVYSLYVPYIYIYIFPKYVPCISLVCFLVYWVKSRSGHDRNQSFGSISHVSGPKLSF